MPEEQKQLRAYILGEIGENEIAAVEERLMTDDDFFRELSVVEETVIQDYVDGHLDAAQRAAFERRFLISEENRQRVKFARALRKYVDETPPAKPEKTAEPGFLAALGAFFTTPVPAALLALIILGFAGFFIWKSFLPSTDSDILAALNKAYRAERPVETRVTGLDHAPLKNTRGADDKTDKTELALARELALKAASETPSAENLHALGRVYLMEKKFDDAIEQFERAVKLAPESAALRSDLGAALLEKGRSLESGNLEILTRANEELARAISLDENLEAAYFNRALTVQTLNLNAEAKAAWQKYLELDPASRWAGEARKNLELLETSRPVSKTKEEILRDFLRARQAGESEEAWQILSRNRGITEGKLIPQQLAFLFIDAKTAGDQTGAGEHLEALRYAGRLEEERSGDMFWTQMAEFYARVPGDKIPVLKRARTAYLEGLDALTKRIDYKAAVSELERAQALYRLAGNDVEPKLLDFIIAYCKNRDSKITQSSAKLLELFESCQKENCKWLAMQAGIWLATNDYSSKRFSAALEKLHAAAAAAGETNDLFNRQKVLSLFTEAYFSLGQFDDAFEAIEQNLLLATLPDASRGERWRALNSATRFFYKIGNFHSAKAFEQEALELARDMKDKTFEFTSSVDLGLVNFALGRSAEALELIEKAREISGTFPDGDYKDKCIAYTNLQLGHIKRQNGEYAESVENYRKAIEFYDAGEFRVHGYDAHRGLLLSRLAGESDADVDAELSAILEIFKTYREQIIEEQNRNSFFDSKQDVYDIAIDVSFGRADYAKAFDYAEESRSRSLLDLQNSPVRISAGADRKPEITFSSSVVEPAKLGRIQAEMPENAQLLQYSVLGDRTLIWLVTKENLTAAESGAAAESLKEKVFAYLELIERNADADERSRLSAELYDILIGPVREKLDPDKEVFIVPDKFLFNLPFNTLFSGKYLIEDYRLSYAPSANVFLFCSKKAEALGGKTSETLLSIGNPKFNRAEYEQALQPLTAARREAEEIARLYEDPLVFTEEKAAKDQVRENFGRADVVHFAGHYVVDQRAPLLSALVLAGDKRSDSDLANYELIGEKHSRMRLIVLSACQTGVEKYYNGEGMIGAARTFLAAGVPLVVASQWAVDSDASKELMVSFHRYRKTDRLSTAEALRRAQIEMLRSEKYRQPYYWAAFASIGGYAKF